MGQLELIPIIIFFIIFGCIVVFIFSCWCILCYQMYKRCREGNRLPPPATYQLTHPAWTTPQPSSCSTVQPPQYGTVQPLAYGTEQPPTYGTLQAPYYGSVQPPGREQPPTYGTVQAPYSVQPCINIQYSSRRPRIRDMMR